MTIKIIQDIKEELEAKEFKIIINDNNKILMSNLKTYILLADKIYLQLENRHLHIIPYDKDCLTILLSMILDEETEIYV